MPIVLSRDRRRMAHSNSNRFVAAFCLTRDAASSGLELDYNRSLRASARRLALFDAKKSRIYAEGLLSL